MLAEATAHSFDSNTVVTYTLSEAYKRDVLLASISSADWSSRVLPFGRGRIADVGFAAVYAQRVSYVGEPGYELYCPTEVAAHVYESLVETSPAGGRWSFPVLR